MIKYYLRPDQAYFKIDSENKIIINILIASDNKLIGHITNVDYVDSMINTINNRDTFISIDEETFNNALAEAKAFISAI
jgi:hypothetical protein